MTGCDDASDCSAPPLATLPADILSCTKQFSSAKRSAASLKLVDSSDAECCVAAVLHNGGSEVGVALCRFPSMIVSLTQFSDTCRWYKTRALLCVHDPVEVLLPVSARHDSCTRWLLQQFQDEITFTGVDRRCFQSEAGVRLLKRVQSKQISDVDRTLIPSSFEDQTRYLCFAAANAVLMFIERITDTVIQAGTVRVQEVTLDHYLAMSRGAATALHMVPARASGSRSLHPASPATASGSSCRTQTLLESIPAARTRMGKRFLFASLLQPLRDAKSIELRQDAVAWLLEDDTRVSKLHRAMGKLAACDIECILSSFLHRVQLSNDARKRRYIESLLSLRVGLDGLDAVEKCLGELVGMDTQCGEPTQPQLLVHIVASMREWGAIPLEEKLDSMLDTAARQMLKHAGDNVPQVTRRRRGRPVDPSALISDCTQARTKPVTHLLRTCFALASSERSRLDALRSEYSALADQIQEHYWSVRMHHRLTSLLLEEDSLSYFCLSYATAEQSLANNAKFLYSRPAESLSGRRPSRKESRIRCTTEVLEALCRRAASYCSAMLDEEARLANEFVETLLVPFVGNLQASVEAIALIDTLLSFAQYAKRNHCVRPAIAPPGVPSTDAGENFFIRDGRHPSLLPGYASVPFSISWKAGVRLMIVTGPNSGGKTTLLRQVGQLCALAQSGCFIPAASARIPMFDRIITHMLCDDDPNVLESSFRREVTELAEASHSITSESLVLFDEIGRSTTTSNGFCFAWATAQFLRTVQPFSLFSTHFAGITEMSTVFQDTDNSHFAVVDVPNAQCRSPGESASSSRLAESFFRNAHQLLPGPCHDKHYGIAIAERIGLFPPILEGATYLIHYEMEVRQAQTDAARVEFERLLAPRRATSPVGARRRSKSKRGSDDRESPPGTPRLRIRAETDIPSPAHRASLLKAPAVRFP